VSQLPVSFSTLFMGWRSAVGADRPGRRHPARHDAARLDPVEALRAE